MFDSPHITLDLNRAPDPRYSPQDVVGIQLDALQINDLLPDNRGIRQAYGFAAPAVRAHAGPLERFILLVKNPLYARMVGFLHARLAPLVLRDGIAYQRVLLTCRDGSVQRYLFVLRCQSDAPYTDCWMTEGVTLA
jgi:hypothetical protein